MLGETAAQLAEGDFSSEDALQLIETLGRLRLATEMAGIGVYDLDLASDAGIWSPTTFELLGLPVPPDRIGRSADWRNLVHPDDREIAFRDYDHGRLTGGAWRTQFRFYRADDGQLRWLSVAGQFLHEHGSAVRSSGIVMDITDQKCAEADAANARLRLERIS